MSLLEVRSDITKGKHHGGKCAACRNTLEISALHFSLCLMVGFRLALVPRIGAKPWHSTWVEEHRAQCQSQQVQEANQHASRHVLPKFMEQITIFRHEYTTPPMHGESYLTENKGKIQKHLEKILYSYSKSI